MALLVFTGALSIFLSAVNVYLRDTQHLTEVLLMAWFWVTPIVYSYGQISKPSCQGPPPSLAQVRVPAQPDHPDRHDLPTGHLRTDLSTVDRWRDAITTAAPDWGIGTYALGLVGLVLVVSSVLFLLALIVFGRLEGNFAEEL